MKNPLMSVAVEAARAAARQILKGFERPDLLKLTAKGERDFATDTDLKAEQAIIEIIQKTYPKHAILSEEAGKIGENEITWIIDPLDGTRNFIHACPHFAVSIAMQVNGKTEHGVIYDPIRDELFTASAGRGAQLNGRRLRVLQRPLEQALISLIYPMPDKKEAMDFAAKVATLAPVVGSLRTMGSAVLDFAYVAAGRFDGCIVNASKMWDYAAGVLLIQEAGGLVTDWQGREEISEHGQLIAAHPKLFKSLLSTVK